MDSFLRGILIGFSIAAPVGPIGVLCIRRTLADGRLSGFLSGLGAATADAAYGAVAAFGLASLSRLLVSQQAPLRVVGGLFLLYLGLRTLLSKPSARPAVAARGALSAYGSTLLLTLANPATIISFAAVFAGFGLATGGGYFPASLLVAGVFTGSALWWFLLSGVVSLFRVRFNEWAIRWVNVVSGGVITAFGLAALASVLLT
jgi:threonine/homoserine/homoserine lactone efflux protein